MAAEAVLELAKPDKLARITILGLAAAVAEVTVASRPVARSPLTARTSAFRQGEGHGVIVEFLSVRMGTVKMPVCLL